MWRRIGALHTPVNIDRRRRISQLYHAARQRPVAERSAFLATSCGDDPGLRREIESLLADDAKAWAFVADAPTEVMADRLGAGARLGAYQIERPLGRGGMGVVLLAHDATLRRRVALKVLEGSPAEGLGGRAHLLREARNAAALNHPNICTVYEVGEADGRAFIAMEYVDGRPLSDRLAGGPLPPDEAVRYGIEAADALAHAHEHGVIHRDLKAANAMVSAEGRLKLVDFGLARREDALAADASAIGSLAAPGVPMGTPYSMAPEQVRGGVTDARTDIWALGVLLYEMASGSKPFTAASMPELFSSILRDAPQPLPGSVPAELRSVIERCLQKWPEDRYQQAADVGAALEGVRAGTRQPRLGWRAMAQRHAWAASVVAGLALAALLVGENAGGIRDWLAGTAPAAGPIGLAVLPFDNLTGDPEQDYFSDGLTEEMIAQLGRLHPDHLSVIARTSSMQYKDRDASIDEIGRELGVDYVLEGSARRDGARVRVNVTLIRVRDQTQQWADSFDRELLAILTLQSDIARSVAESLSLTLLPPEEARLAGARAVNPEAYEAYLRAALTSSDRRGRTSIWRWSTSKLRARAIPP
jgi:non-specific serine/threonine protein kinase